MKKNALFVDDDRILRHLVKRKFQAYSGAFTILLASDGVEAVQILKETPVSIVITDLQMPNMDGFALLAHLSEIYPDIPVIVQTGFGTPELKKRAIDTGATFIEKPFVAEDLAVKIIEVLQKENEGGTLQTVSMDMFIQLIEMDQKTCTIRAFNKITEDQGVLFFHNGDLMDARVKDRQGNTAAYEILAWDSVTISIQDECAITDKKIEGELQAILFDAMRMKDEATSAPEDFEEKPPEPKKAPPKKAPAKQAAPKKQVQLSYPDMLRKKFKTAAGSTDSLDDIYVDGSWYELLEHAKLIAPLFSAGSFKLCYINRGARLNLIVMPGEEPTVVAVTADCPVDQVLTALRK
jgi:CheY-like chemotaxis protein